jgi:hypothetical protein
MIEQIQMIELINAKAFVDIRCIPVSLFSSLFIYFNFLPLVQAPGLKGMSNKALLSKKDAFDT